VILFHHIAGAQLLAAPAHSATAALRVASPCIATQHHALRRIDTYRFAALRVASPCTATQRNFKRNPASPNIPHSNSHGAIRRSLGSQCHRCAPHGFAPPHCAPRRIAPHRSAAPHNATQFQKEPCPSPSPIQIPMARSDASLGHSAPRGAALHSATQLNAITI